VGKKKEAREKREIYREGLVCVGFGGLYGGGREKMMRV